MPMVGPKLLFALSVLLTADLASTHDPHPVLTLSDLDQLVETFSGEFDNSAQNQQDVDSGATGDDLHFLIQRFHVPVRIPSLEEAAGTGAATRQIYLEQYYNNGPTPRQRIFNFVLKRGEIDMELHQAVNASITEAWKNWRTDRSVFEEIGSDDLRFDSQCNSHWSRDGACTFTSVIPGNNCIFTFFGQEVYIDSKVNVTSTQLIQDEAFLSTADGSKVSGANTPYIYDRISDIAPLPQDNTSNTCMKLIEPTCQLLKNMKKGRVLLYYLVRSNSKYCFEGLTFQNFLTDFC